MRRFAFLSLCLFMVSKATLADTNGIDFPADEYSAATGILSDEMAWDWGIDAQFWILSATRGYTKLFAGSIFGRRTYHVTDYLSIDGGIGLETIEGVDSGYYASTKVGVAVVPYSYPSIRPRAKLITHASVGTRTQLQDGGTTRLGYDAGAKIALLLGEDFSLNLGYGVKGGHISSSDFWSPSIELQATL